MTLNKKKFRGTMSRDRAVVVDFEAWAGEDGRLQVDVQPMEPRDWLMFQGAMGEPGSFSEALTLEGASDDGATFFSDSIDVRGATSGTQRHIIKVGARQAKVTLQCDGTVETPRMRLWFRGFTSFRAPTVKTSLGLVKVAGQPKATADEMCGSVMVQAEKDTGLSGWVDRADAFLTFMHRGLSFAHGNRLQTPRLDFAAGNRWEATFYEGEGFGPGLAPIHHLNQGPFIEALARRYEDSKPFPDMLWTAIGWLHADNQFDEARFLMSMTALEAIVEHVIPKTLTTVMPKDAFDDVKTRLLSALGQGALDSTVRQIFEGKIKGLNGRTLSQKIQALRDHYGLATSIFTDQAIVEAIKARNDLVHTGQSVNRQEIWPKVIFVRELISQIVFREIGYSGPYESYLGGYKTVQSRPKALGAATSD